MRILMAGAELSEVASVGGVGEYTLGLAGELSAQGHEVEVVVPLYGYIAGRAQLEDVTDRLIAPLGVGSSECATVRRWPASGLPFRVTLIGAHRHFACVRSPADIYREWPNHEPWIAFSRAILEHVRVSGFDPDILHCLDSHTALVPVFMREAQRRRWECPPPRPATVLTIHNLLNQGRGDPGVLEWAGLDPAYWYHDWFEFYGTVNCYKAGLLTADRVSSVSRTYVAEICASSDFGFGLEGILASLRDRRRLEWVLNGITPARWSLPGITYGEAAAAADVRRVAAQKRQRRGELFSGWGWTDDGPPVIATRSRWDRQKGVVELVGCIRSTLDAARHLLVTWGERDTTPQLGRAWRTLVQLQRERPDRLQINPPSLEGQANGANHYAAADFLLVPSWYEPCGLTQMECQRFGTVPIVRRTGGLGDTVSEVPTGEFPSPNGYVFSEPLGEHMAERMAEAVRRALSGHGTPAGAEMILQCLRQDHSWASRITAYESLYRSAADHRLDEVIGCLSQRAASRRGQGDRHGEASALRDLGAAYAGRGRRDEAREHWQHAGRLFTELGSPEADEVESLLTAGG